MEALKQPLESISLTDILTPVQMRVENIMRALSLTELVQERKVSANDIGIEVENFYTVEYMAISGADRESLKKELIELILNGK